MNEIRKASQTSLKLLETLRKELFRALNGQTVFGAVVVFVAVLVLLCYLGAAKKLLSGHMGQAEFFANEVTFLTASLSQ